MFRALIKKGEKSKRTLELTELIIQMNPGHYSVWSVLPGGPCHHSLLCETTFLMSDERGFVRDRKYRADTLLELKTELVQELELLDAMVKQHLKSYQVWYGETPPPYRTNPADPVKTDFEKRFPFFTRRQHRRTIVLALDDPSRELDFTARALSFDAKNYHTWAYRQFVLCHFYSDAEMGSSPASRSSRTSSKEERDKVWSGELDYVEKLIRDDIRNNSAWNQRFFVAFESQMGGADVGEREIECVFSLVSVSWRVRTCIAVTLIRPSGQQVRQSSARDLAQQPFGVELSSRVSDFFSSFFALSSLFCAAG